MKWVLCLLLLIPASLFAQRKLNLTIFGGFSNYSGELQEKRFTLDQAHLSFGAGLLYPLSDKLALHGTLSKGKVSAHDKFSSNPANRARNLQFLSNIYEAALSVQYLLFSLNERKATPYVFGGVALFRFNPWGAGGELKSFSTEGQGFVDGRKPYSLITFSSPFGGGVKMRITETVYLGYEVGLRKTLTDYIDDVSTTYVDENLLRENRGQLAVDVAFRGDELDRTLPYPAAGTLRGSPKTQDWYYFSGITLSVGITNRDGRLFGKNLRKGSVDCPKW